MEQIKVVCPNCKNRLTIPNMQGIQDKLLACPICSFKAKVSVYQNTSAYGGGGSNDEPTQVSLAMLDKTIGSLYIDGKEFALKQGRTVVGRKATTSTATMQIPTEDMYMSRVHACITAKTGANGTEHTLEPMNPKNPIKVNGIPLVQGDIVILNWGDRLLFGKTEVVFNKPKVSDNDNENTILV